MCPISSTQMWNTHLQLYPCNKIDCTLSKQHGSTTEVCSLVRLGSGIWQHLLKMLQHQHCYHAALHILQSHGLCHSNI